MKEIQGPAKAGLEFINRRKKTQTKKKSEPKRTPPKKNSNTELAFQFRQYAKTHDLYKIESDTNCLKLEDAFGDPIKAVFQELSSKKHLDIGLLIKQDFSALLELARKFDKLNRQGCTDKNERLSLKHFQSEITQSLEDLAKLIEDVSTLFCPSDPSGNTPQAKTPPTSHPKKSRKILSVPPSPVDNDGGRWLTVAEVAEMMDVHPGTVSRWAGQGHIKDNGKSRSWRRLSEASVLLYKNAIEARDRRQDNREVRRDARKLDRYPSP